MLKRFEVSGFKNFKQPIVLDFSDVRDYKFNEACIQNRLLNKIIIYGKNGVGKSNLGLALFDITTHLVDKNVTPGVYHYYLNADQHFMFAEFRYIFQLESGEVDYLYQKSDFNKLTYEQLIVNGEPVFSYDFLKKSGDLSGLEKLVPSLNYEFKDNSLSILRYVVNNTLSDAALPLKQLVRFVNNMLWFRNFDEKRYIGYKTDSSDYVSFIFENNYLEQFQQLLYKAGINEELAAIKRPDGELELCFKKNPAIPFFRAASSGTRSLYALFYWLITAEDVSFMFIDEFDAFYHFELSELIVQLLEDRHEFQTILTSHNTNLLSNRIMRPDCYFILTTEKLVSLANATERELREGHNLEKLYMSGEFNA